MLAIEGSFLDFKLLDRLAMQQTPLHRLDPRAKLITTILFVCSVVSFDRYALSALLPFLIYPVVLLAAGNLPAGVILRKVLIVVPFALMIGLFNPLVDRQVLMQIGSLDISGGWVSWGSILLRALLTASAAIILVAMTGFQATCQALEKLGMPRALVVQLGFLYRYIFVLTDEAVRTARARQLRSFDNHGLGLRQFGSLVGHLLLRTWERAERIHLAMLLRGFSGEIHSSRPMTGIGRNELLFMCGWGSLFLLMRCYNVPQLIGGLLTGIFS